MFANGAGTSFVNHGVMNVGAWTLDGNQPDLQNYAVAVTGGATASNAGTINVGVNATTLDSQVIGGLVAGGSFTNEAGGTITLGRSAQYAPGGPATTSHSPRTHTASCSAIPAPRATSARS